MRIATLANAAVGHTLRRVEELRARGHEVGVWSLEPGPAGLGAWPLPAPPLPGFLRYPLAAPALRRALARFAPDLVDAHFVPNYGLLGALGGRRPLAVTAWGSDLLVTGGRDPLQRARARFVLGRADLVLADAANLARAARALGAPAARVHEVPWGVDLGRYRASGDREPGLLLSTRMHEPVYDLDTLIRGVAPVMVRRPGTRLVVAGEGSLRGAHERLAARLLPAGRWEFIGMRPPASLAESLARAEIYLSSARSDSTSLSLLEAMAAGALPVVTDIEGNREWVSEGEGARLFPPGDPGALAAALERALDARAWAEAARSRNRRVVEARGDRERNLDRIEALFRALVDGRVPPGGAGVG
ncbi:MAG: glycosyltransferase [Candidatus Eiseniibacteriota bacterium]